MLAPSKLASFPHSKSILTRVKKRRQQMPSSFGVIYLFAPKLTPVMIAFLNQCLKQCSNHSSYLMQAAHQISIIPLKANTINIPFHYSIFFSTAPLLEHLLLSLSSRTNLFRCFQNPVQTASLGVKDSSSSPAMASLSEIPRVRYSLSPAIVRHFCSHTYHATV